jgi:hypothetical protein
MNYIEDTDRKKKCGKSGHVYNEHIGECLCCGAEADFS